MGRDRAVLAAAGIDTIVREVDQATLDKGLGRIKKFLEDGVAKGKVTAEDKDRTLAHIKGRPSSRTWPVRAIIEAAIENIAAKREVFGTLGKVTQPDAVLASNTSSLSITEIAARPATPSAFWGSTSSTRSRS